MKCFDVNDYLKDEKFQMLIEKVVFSKDGNSLIDAIKDLDEFYSSCSNMDKTYFAFENIKGAGEFKWNPMHIAINNRFCDCKDNVSLLSVYLHEKRHHLQYLCYLTENDLLGKEILQEIDSYMKKDDLCVISKRSIFLGNYGYEGRLIERDAYLYEYESMMSLCKIGEKWWGAKQNEEIYNKYYRKKLMLEDPEFLHWISEHKKEFEIRKFVEESLLEDVKETIKYNVNNKNLRKIICSQKLFNCLSREEQLKISRLIGFKDAAKVEKSEQQLEKIIIKQVSKQMKQKKSRSL